VNVLFVSQCSGNALKETRRILDQFAERRGDRAWQTPITQAGLETVHRLLRKRARKNTAVACYRLRRTGAEPLWVVGDASRFNAWGATPTDTTRRDVLREKDEDDWRHGTLIALLAALAALFHDFGKASRAFQNKLKRNAQGKDARDAYRHEWVSLRLFQALVGDAADDRQWLARLTDPEADLEDWAARLERDGLDARSHTPLAKLPPLARVVGWLILSHHRLPQGKTTRRRELEQVERVIRADWGYADPDAKAPARRACWDFPHGLPTASRAWRRKAARIARALLEKEEHLQENWLDKPFVAHLARLVLMLADHHYSSRPADPSLGDADHPLYANTDRDGTLKQRLDEHLVGVQRTASAVAWQLPRLAWKLPRIARHKGFQRRTRAEPYRWQNKAYDLACAVRERARRGGFFGVNMASTGTGKTLANGRILYGLADPWRGARFTVALGLRVLTLQTGDVFRERMALGPEDLAVLVGGAATRELHGLARAPGSESAADLLDEATYVHYEGSLEDGPLSRWLERQPSALVQAPVVVCTVDHLVPATEGVRGGRQILPMLRLLSADLVLDEVDDYDVKDLPAITRLVHWAGLLGSRVLLSSATLPPALVAGLFQAYLEGRRAYQASCGEPGPLNVCCAWFDEFRATAEDHAQLDGFRRAHEQFVERRVRRLHRAPVRRRARIREVAIDHTVRTHEECRPQFHARLADCLAEGIAALHRDNAQRDPDTGRRVSVGLVRLANIEPLVATAVALAARPAPAGHRFHLAVYHARFPLFRRAHLERRLDRLLQRHEPGSLFRQPEIRAALAAHEEAEQVFVVLASPVAEVGRDHDYDWALVEPSSLRSLIQLAGRVRRHRPKGWERQNLELLHKNLRALRGKDIAYTRPGYESRAFPLRTHDLRELLRPEELARIDATPRIRPTSPLEPDRRLADLEHAVIADLMLATEGKNLPVTRWWETRAHLTAVLQREQPFRAGEPTGDYVLLPDEDDHLRLHRLDPTAQSPVLEDYLRRSYPLHTASGVTLWGGDEDDLGLLEALAQTLDMDLTECARRFATVRLPRRQADQAWWYHPWFGFAHELATGSAGEPPEELD